MPISRHLSFFSLPLSILLTTTSLHAAAEEQGQAGASGFIEGQSLGLSTRNFAAQERRQDSWHFNIPKSDGSREPTYDRSTWVQGTQLNYSSGYSQGPVGFGLDVGAFAAVNLERGKGAIAGGGNRTLAENDGRGVAEWSKLGVADLRARVSSTELKVGRFIMDTPVFGSLDNRPLPSSFDGVAISSAELGNLVLQAASFTKASPRTGAGDEPFTTEYGTREVKGDRFSYLGGTYTPISNLELSGFAGRFKDIWDQYYLGVTHTAGDSQTLALKTAFTGYHTQDSGKRLAGYIDNSAYSLAFTLTHQAHALTFGWQQIHGDEYFDYVHETGAIYLANSLFSDYN
ncbi:MAG: OprD family outer membrane porin, partial [Pseudomonas sp.]